MKLDHLAITADGLSEGTAATEAALGVSLAPGGQHPLMGTHNRLLSLGPDAYLEVIAVDPDAPDPGRARWFELDTFTGPARLSTWVVSVEDLTEVLARMPEGSGRPLALSRGALHWQMAVPDTGKLPFDGVFPALIDWQGATPPAARLPEAGCRLQKLVVSHPQSGQIAEALAGLNDPRIVFRDGEPGLQAEVQTPSGLVVL